MQTKQGQLILYTTTGHEDFDILGVFRVKRPFHTKTEADRHKLALRCQYLEPEEHIRWLAMEGFIEPTEEKVLHCDISGFAVITRPLE